MDEKLKKERIEFMLKKYIKEKTNFQFKDKGDIATIKSFNISNNLIFFQKENGDIVEWNYNFNNVLGRLAKAFCIYIKNVKIEKKQGEIKNDVKFDDSLPKELMGETTRTKRKI